MEHPTKAEHHRELGCLRQRASWTKRAAPGLRADQLLHLGIGRSAKEEIGLLGHRSERVLPVQQMWDGPKAYYDIAIALPVPEDNGPKAD